MPRRLEFRREARKRARTAIASGNVTSRTSRQNRPCHRSAARSNGGRSVSQEERELERVREGHVRELCGG